MNFDYATWAQGQARREPSGQYRDLLVEIKAEKARRAAALSVPSSSPTAAGRRPTPCA